MEKVTLSDLQDNIVEIEKEYAATRASIPSEEQPVFDELLQLVAKVSKLNSTRMRIVDQCITLAMLTAKLHTLTHNDLNVHLFVLAMHIIALDSHIKADPKFNQ